MRRVTRLLFCLVFVLGCSAQATAEELAEKIDAVMQEFVALDQFSGTVLVARGGDILYARAFGEANKDHHVRNILETRYNIGSIGKTLTGVAVMQLVERGKIALDAPVASYLEGFPHGDGITVHHLLSHTSGMANYMGHPDYRARMARIRSIACCSSISPLRFKRVRYWPANDASSRSSDVADERATSVGAPSRRTASDNSSRSVLGSGCEHSNLTTVFSTATQSCSWIIGSTAARRPLRRACCT